MSNSGLFGAIPLRYTDGRPVTYRRYDGLWVRIGRHLPWVRTQQISTHWIRHTTLTWVERNFGFAVAHAGHTDGAGDTGSATSTYVRVTLTEVATALAALTGEPHLLAEPLGGQAGQRGTPKQPQAWHQSSGSTTRQSNTAWPGCSCWPTTSKPRSSTRQNVVRSARRR